MDVYYNDNEPYVAEWLRNLIAAGELPPGDVDERPIQEIDPGDLEGYGQLHFFAGIGGWPLALRLAGWPDDREVWTGSCPCQPLSSAGQRKGHADERHLWPAFYALIAECRPSIVLGEQVASKDGREWLAGVRADLEHLGYAVGAADLPAAGVGAPQIRQRLWWVADAGLPKPQGRDEAAENNRRGSGTRRVKGRESTPCGPDGGMANAISQRRQQERRGPQGDESEDGRRPESRNQPPSDGTDGGVDDTPGSRRPRQEQPGEAGAPRHEARVPESERRGGTSRLARADGGDASPEGLQRGGQHRQQPQDGGVAGGVGGAARDGWDEERPHDRGGDQGSEAQGSEQRPLRNGATGFWDDFNLIPCGDGKVRRVPKAQPGLQPLATRLPAAMDGLGPVSRVGALRGAGNSISPPLAAEFIRAVMEILPERN